jgi:hypothetical protein
VFRPENLLNWQPESEPDVYIAFGILQEYTQYRYCCATSTALNTKLGFTVGTKPDAILISNDTDEYLVAEFKMQSSSFKVNHQRTDIDVLIVWQDDEENRGILPPTVVCLEEIARLAAIEIINKAPED